MKNLEVKKLLNIVVMSLATVVVAGGIMLSLTGCGDVTTPTTTPTTAVETVVEEEPTSQEILTDDTVMLDTESNDDIDLSESVESTPEEISSTEESETTVETESDGESESECSQCATEEMSEEMSTEMSEEMSEEMSKEMSEEGIISEDSEGDEDEYVIEPHDVIIQSETMTEKDGTKYAVSKMNIRSATTTKPDADGAGEIVLKVEKNQELAVFGTISTTDSQDSSNWTALGSLVTKDSSDKETYQVVSNVTYKDNAQASKDKVWFLSRQIDTITVDGNTIKADDLAENQEIRIVYARTSLLSNSKVTEQQKTSAEKSSTPKQTQQQTAPADDGWSGLEGMTACVTPGCEGCQCIMFH